MKTKIFLGMGLLVTAVGFGQTTHYATAPGAAGTGGTDEVHIGDNAGENSSIPPLPGIGYNVYVGNNSGQYNTDSHNVFVGYNAGRGSTQISTGGDNSFFGSGAGISATGRANTFIGRACGKQSIGNSNVFVGLEAGNFVQGDFNVGLGNNAGGGQGGNNEFNVFIGHQAGLNSVGNNNTLLGNKAGTGVEGSANVLIGNNVGKNLVSSNKLYIDNSDTSHPLIYGNFTNGAEELKFNAYKVGIGPEFGDFPALTGLTNADKYRLFVRGGILAEEVRIRLQNNWPDYVFAKDYKLLSLKDTEKFIAESGHLPNMPSAEKIKAEGVELGNIVTLQQEKIEELTLHLIEQQKQIEELQKQVQLLLNK